MMNKDQILTKADEAFLLGLCETYKRRRWEHMYEVGKLHYLAALGVKEYIFDRMSDDPFFEVWMIEWLRVLRVMYGSVMEGRPAEGSAIEAEKRDLFRLLDKIVASKK